MKISFTILTILAFAGYVLCLPRIEAWSEKGGKGTRLTTRWFQDYDDGCVPWPSGTQSIKWLGGGYCAVNVCYGHNAEKRSGWLNNCPSGVSYKASLTPGYTTFDITSAGIACYELVCGWSDQKAVP